jgi:signal peptidase
MRTAISRTCNGLGTAILLLVILAAGSVMGLTLLGYTPMAVLSGSMEPAYHVGGLVFIDTNVTAEEIAVGDSVTFTLSADTVVTHRVTAIDAAARAFLTKGDANDSPDLAPVPFEALVGRAAFHIPGAGYALMNLKTTKGFAAGALLVAILIALFVVPVLLAPGKSEKPAETAGTRKPEDTEPTTKS